MYTTGLLAVLGGFIFILIIIGILYYIFNALGFYTMAKNRGINHAWISWIPFLQNFILGELIDDHVWGIGGARWILLVCPLVIGWMNGYITGAGDEASTIIVSIFSILSIVYYVYLQCAHYRLFKAYSDHAVGYTIWSIIFPFLAPIFIFIIRKHPYKTLNK